MLYSEIELRLSLSHLRQFLKETLSMIFRKVNHLTCNHNYPVNKLKRQVAAGQYITWLSQGWDIINIDETIFQSTDNRRYSWVSYDQNTLLSDAKRLSRVSMVAACTSKVDLLFTINQGYTTGKMFLLFLIKLACYLNSQDSNWRSHTVLMIDNAPYHRSAEMQRAYKQLKLPIMFLGPYQFHMAPVEKVFRYIKNRDLNPLRTRAQSTLAIWT